MNYFRPQKLSQALSWLAQNDAAIAAGCTDLFAATNSQYLQKSESESLLDITAIDGLDTITATNEGIRIGAAVKWSEITNAHLPPAFDSLKAAAREIGSVQIQNSGTIGGNLCNASPAADGVPPLLIVDAQVELASVSGTRTLPLQEFLQGPRRTALRRDEMLISILVPKTSTGGKSTFIKLGARKYLVISIAMVAARLSTRNDRITNAAISIGSCSAVAIRLSGIEMALKDLSIKNLQDGVTLGQLVSAEILARDLLPIDDIRANASYRLTAAREIAIRAIEELVSGGNAS